MKHLDGGETCIAGINADPEDSYYTLQQAWHDEVCCNTVPSPHMTLLKVSLSACATAATIKLPQCCCSESSVYTVFWRANYVSKYADNNITQ